MRLTKKLTGTILIALFSLQIVFHLLVLSRLIPFGIVWGGRLKTVEQMQVFELISILINALMLYVAAAGSGHLKHPFRPAVLRVALWVMVLLFALNTLGNIFSENRFEQLVFTPLTALLALLCLHLARSGNKH